MKLGILLFACMALINFAKVGAMDDVDRAGRGGAGQGGAGRGGAGQGGAGQGSALVGRGRRPSPPVITSHPDLPRYALYPHNHPIDVQNPVPGNPQRASKRVIISKIVDGMPAHWHFLSGELLPDSNITSCDAPYGYAVVNLYDRNLLYACLRPVGYHNETMHREHVSTGASEFITYVIREGMPKLEGVLTTGSARITLRTNSPYTWPGLRPSGHVRYIKYDQYFADGFIYQFVDHLE